MDSHPRIKPATFRCYIHPRLIIAMGLLPAIFRSHMLEDGPTNFHPLFFQLSDISAFIGAPSVCWVLCQLLGCTMSPTSPKPYTWLNSRPKKEPRVSDRDIHGSKDGVTYMSDARSWSNTHRQDAASVFTPSFHCREKWKVISYGGIAVRWAHPWPGIRAGGHAPVPL